MKHLWKLIVGFGGGAVGAIMLMRAAVFLFSH